jgi:hypothetical protein
MFDKLLISIFLVTTKMLLKKLLTLIMNMFHERDKLLYLYIL